MASASTSKSNVDCEEDMLFHVIFRDFPARIVHESGSYGSPILYSSAVLHSEMTLVVRSLIQNVKFSLFVMSSFIEYSVLCPINLRGS